MRRFVVVGTGRSGTTWCAETLQAAGLRCGHQAVFRHEHVLDGGWEWGDAEGDVSYEAVPLLRGLAGAGTRIVLVVRDPIAVARSWIALGAFTDRMDAEFSALRDVLAGHLPVVLSYSTPEDQAVAFWLHWNLAAARHADVILPLDRLTPEILLSAVDHGHRTAQHLPPANRIEDHPAGGPPPDLTWSDVSSQLAQHAALTARAWGVG